MAADTEWENWCASIDAGVAKIRKEVQEGGDLNTALHNAAFYGYEPLLQELVEAGADILSEDQHGRVAARIYADCHLRFNDIPQCLLPKK